MKRPSLLLVCKAFLDLRFGGAVLYGFFFFLVQLSLQREVTLNDT